MKKLKSKNLKIILAAFGTTLLMTPIVAVTTVACSAQSLSQEKTIEIKTQPVNQSAIIGQNENLPTFSVQAQTKDFSKNLNYQWYSSMIESNENGTKIDGANSSTYVVPKNKLLKVQKYISMLKSAVIIEQMNYYQLNQMSLFLMWIFYQSLI